MSGVRQAPQRRLNPIEKAMTTAVLGGFSDARRVADAKVAATRDKAASEFLFLKAAITADAFEQCAKICDGFTGPMAAHLAKLIRKRASAS